MVCPFCSRDIQELWQPFVSITDWQGNALSQPRHGTRTITKPEKRKVDHIEVDVYWAVCEKCRELMIKIRKKATRTGSANSSVDYIAKQASEEAAWLALPQRRAVAQASSLIPAGMVRDYREAHSILDDSPRMSSVLSRRILTDLLEQYGQIKAYTLAQQIDRFIAAKHHPRKLRENLHYLRELGDFSAHTKKDATGEIIEVEPAEAEWTLRVVSQLFDYFIVEPETDRSIRARVDQKIKEAGRKPIKQLSESECAEDTECVSLNLPNERLHS